LARQRAKNYVFCNLKESQLFWLEQSLQQFFGFFISLQKMLV
jgi:hypothetical protein